MADKDWEEQMRDGFATALASVMSYLRDNFETVVSERNTLRKRVEYLEQRLEEALKDKR